MAQRVRLWVGLILTIMGVGGPVVHRLLGY